MIEIEKPTVECVELNDDNTYGKFVLEPLERGYGTTIGNSLRRVLLDSVQKFTPMTKLRSCVSKWKNRV